jgi:opacity protein-like surface antigen
VIRSAAKRFLAMAVAGAMMWSPLAAAVIHLKDGSRVRGTVVSATARQVQIHTEDGTRNVPADNILRIDYAEEVEPGPPPGAPESRRYIREDDAEDLVQLFSFDLGLASPLSRVDTTSTGGTPARNGGTGLRLGVEYLYYVNKRLGVGLDFHYFHRSALDDSGFIPNGHTRISGDTIAPILVAKYSLTGRGAARPYVLAGAGVNHTSMIIDTQPFGGFRWSDTNTAETRRLVDDSRWGPAARAAVGVDFKATSPSIFSFEVGWTGIFNERYDGTPSGVDLGVDGVTGLLNTLTIALRWGWRF